MDGKERVLRWELFIYQRRVQQMLPELHFACGACGLATVRFVKKFIKPRSSNRPLKGEAR
jgi:hypothetical protein